MDLSKKWLSLENQVRVAFAAAVILLLGIGVVSYHSIRQFISAATWDRHTYEVIASIHELHAGLKDAESDTRGYVITDDKRYLETNRTAAATAAARLNALKIATGDNAYQQIRIDSLRPLIARRLVGMQDQRRYRDDPEFDVNRATQLALEATKIMDRIDGVLQEMQAEENRLLAMRRASTEATGHRAIQMIVIGSFIDLLIVGFAGWAIRGSLAAKKNTEDALRASSEMFRGLLESAPDAMVIANDKGGIEFFNARAETIFGYTAEELMGQPIEMIVPDRSSGKHAAEQKAFLADFLGSGTGVAGTPVLGQDMVAVRKDGSEFPVEISLCPVRTPSGVRVSSAIRDITRHKQEDEALKLLNATLQARTSDLEVANKELESFSYSVSHDLRAPLRSIDGFSQAILEDNGDKLDAESRDNLNRVRMASQRMGHLIDDLLKLARLSRMEMSREPVDLSHIAHEVVDELRAASPECKTECEIAEGIVSEADPRLVRVVLTNLISNAWKFSAKQPAGRIEFGSVAQDGKEEYYVRDNGVGFDMTYVGKLFGAFQRLHSAKEFPGTGVGLATVQRIVHRHGGRIWAEAKIDSGATFHFTLLPAA